MAAAATPSHAPPRHPGWSSSAPASAASPPPGRWRARRRDVIVIDRRNYHLFQPLLYQVATAALSPADIAWPIRAILGRQANASVQLGKVVGVDVGGREVILEDRRVPFDYLVLATGAGTPISAWTSGR